jgi:histone H3/H4
MNSNSETTNSINDIKSETVELYELSESLLRQLCCNFDIKIMSKEKMDEILNKILPQISKKFNITTKRRNRKNIPVSDMCMGRKIDGKQCTRRRINDTEYCKSHNRKLPNGRIDEECKIVVKNSKRGRKRKVDFDPRQVDPEYITMWEDIIYMNDIEKKLLVDKDGNVYSFDTEKPEYLGKKSLESKLVPK